LAASISTTMHSSVVKKIGGLAQGSPYSHGPPALHGLQGRLLRHWLGLVLGLCLLLLLWIHKYNIRFYCHFSEICPLQADHVTVVSSWLHSTVIVWYYYDYY